MTRDLIVCLLLAVVVWLYAPVRNFGLVAEDLPSPAGYALTLAPRALTAWTLSGQSARVAHLWNVAVHLLNGLLFFLLLEPFGGTWAVWLAGIWWLHPLQLESVAYVSGRGELLLVTCILGMLLCAERHWPLGAFLCACLAVWVKETGVVAFPLWWLWMNREVPLDRRLLVLACVPALVMAWRFLPGIEVWRPTPVRPSLWYAGVQVIAVCRYLLLVICPVGFTVDHDFELVGPILASVGLAGCLPAAWFAWRVRSARPALSFAIAWMLVALLPRLLVPQVVFLSERHVPLLLVGSVLALAWSRALKNEAPCLRLI